MGDWFDQQNKADPYTFIPADEFYQSFERSGSGGTQRPSTIFYDEGDQLLTDGSKNPACIYGRVFRFENGALLLIQFMRPKVWRIRFAEKNKNGADFSDYNSRTIVQDTLQKLVEALDQLEQIAWAIEVVEDTQFIVLQSVLNPTDLKARQIVTQLYIQRNPFKITAVRPLNGQPWLEKLPRLRDPSKATEVDTKAVQGTRNAVVWQTKEHCLSYNGSATILSVEKPDRARYLGFGEQGGKDLFKDNVYMNYFNFDNMRYQNVYNSGPKDNREPLYHSEPFWLEVNGHAGYQSKVATFIDNYSHVCVDFGVIDSTAVRIATRFNSFQCIVTAGDSIPEVIQLYTSIVGRPRLKPRYVLGYHQGCYGYDTQAKVMDVIERYRTEGYPIDGMHIDVDIQDNYRTFTIDLQKFPDPKAMFDELRKYGVKCSTNITPVINAWQNDSYKTLNEGLKGGYFIKDKRSFDKQTMGTNAVSQRYMYYEGGHRMVLDPNNPICRANYGDYYNFSQNFNSDNLKWPFHGGVWYGQSYGAPGFYPDLNREDVRVWWGTQYRYLMETGLEFVWQDMTSPCMAIDYGDMKSFPFRLLLSSDGWSGDPNSANEKLSIEIWSLYSYNLHKATYKGLNELNARGGRRNFIIGRGSFAGSHRYAGLWTGDNASTWDFLQISVAQVLALGLSGVSISGADVGGFESAPGQGLFADPELLTRWYCAYSLLPWFRNHYNGKPGNKAFQEPYKYAEYYDANKNKMSDGEKRMYSAVNPVCLYHVRLRYSLLQLLYDAMWENIITGLPIARAMIITDEWDGSLFAENAPYLQGQYMVRNDLLVAPVLLKESELPDRTVYLPRPVGWFSLNLRVDGSLGVPLLPQVPGGSKVSFDAHISNDESHIPYITPMYIREGTIIPQIQVRDHVPTQNPSTDNETPNTVTIHVYPGKDNNYDMYLDDGVSRASAPTKAQLQNFIIPSADGDPKLLADGFGDDQAKGDFRLVHISHRTNTPLSGQGTITRTVTISTPWDGPGYGATGVKRDWGDVYRVVLWHVEQRAFDTSNVDVKGTGGATVVVDVQKDVAMRATVVTVPIGLTVGGKEGLVVVLTHL